MFHELPGRAVLRPERTAARARRPIGMSTANSRAAPTIGVPTINMITSHSSDTLPTPLPAIEPTNARQAAGYEGQYPAVTVPCVPYAIHARHVSRSRVEIPPSRLHIEPDTSFTSVLTKRYPRPSSPTRVLSCPRAGTW